MKLQQRLDGLSLPLSQESYQKINEESITWCSLKNGEKLTRICCLSRRPPTISSLRPWTIWLCMCCPCYGSGQFVASPGFVLPKSSLCWAPSSRHNFTYFHDIWRLSPPHGCVRPARSWTHLKPAHLGWQKSNMHFGTDKSAQQKKVVILNESTPECSFICCVFLKMKTSENMSVELKPW